jgi:hypothetical protein
VKAIVIDLGEPNLPVDPLLLQRGMVYEDSLGRICLRTDEGAVLLPGGFHYHYKGDNTFFEGGVGVKRVFGLVELKR